jgi:hypothetical protein
VTGVQTCALPYSSVDLYIATAFPYKEPLEKGVFKPPVADIYKYVSSKQVSLPIGAVSEEKSDANLVKLVKNELFIELELEIGKDTSPEGDFLVKLNKQGESHAYESKKIRDRNVTPSILNHFYKNQEHLLVFIPKNQITSGSYDLSLVHGTHTALLEKSLGKIEL